MLQNANLYTHTVKGQYVTFHSNKYTADDEATFIKCRNNSTEQVRGRGLKNTQEKITSKSVLEPKPETFRSWSQSNDH